MTKIAQVCLGGCYDAGGWTNPLRKICSSQIGSSSPPKKNGENKKCVKPPPSWWMMMMMMMMMMINERLMINDDFKSLPKLKFSECWPFLLVKNKGFKSGGTNSWNVGVVIFVVLPTPGRYPSSTCQILPCFSEGSMDKNIAISGRCTSWRVNDFEGLLKMHHWNWGFMIGILKNNVMIGFELINPQLSMFTNKYLTKYRIMHRFWRGPQLPQPHLSHVKGISSFKHKPLEEPQQKSRIGFWKTIPLSEWCKLHINVNHKHLNMTTTSTPHDHNLKMIT